MRTRVLCGILAALCLSSPTAAQQISGEGEVSGVGVRLDPLQREAAGIRLDVVSTGAGWGRSSFAQGTGVRAAGEADYAVQGVRVRAQGGPAMQEHESGAVAESMATALGVQVQGAGVQSLDASALQVEAVAASAGAVSLHSDFAQAQSQATATGIWVFMPGPVRLGGESVVTARSGEAVATGGRGRALTSAEASGLRVRNGNAELAGSLTVRAEGGRAEALSAAMYGEANALALGVQTDNGDVRLRGGLTVHAQAGDVLYTESGGLAAGRAYAQAAGVYAAGRVFNTGTVAVSAEGGQVRSGTATRQGAAVATGIRAQGEIVQRGTVQVRADGEGALATGLVGDHVRQFGRLDVRAEGAGSVGTGLVASGDVLNTGDIAVWASGPAMGISISGEGRLLSTTPVRVWSGSGQGWETRADTPESVVRVAGYNLGLGEDLGHTFAGPGRFFMDGATLWLRPARGFVPNQFYRVQSGELASELGPAQIGGEVGRVVSLHADLTAEMQTVAAGPVGEGAGAGGLVQSVALTYTPPSSMPGESAMARQATVMYTGTVVRDQLMAGLLRPMDEREGTARLFVRPYASTLRYSGSPAGYRGHLAGAVLGVDWLLGGWTVGVHGGGDVTRLDFRGAYAGRDEESTAVYGGIHAGRVFANGLAPAFTSTLFRVEHRADHGTYGASGDSGGAETARSRSLVWYNTVGLGYVWQIAAGQTLVPEVVLSHVWQLRSAYSTSSPENTFNTRFSELNDHELFAYAGLRWSGEVPVGEESLRVHAGAGVRRTLTDGKLRVSQTMDGINWARPAVQGERTAGVVSLGVGMRHGAFSWDLLWQGDVAEQARGLGVQAALRWEF